MATANDSTSLTNAVQFAIGPVRAGAARVRRLRALVHRACLRGGSGAGHCRTASVELCPVSIAPTARLILSGAGDGEVEAAAVQQLGSLSSFRLLNCSP